MIVFSILIGPSIEQVIKAFNTMATEGDGPVKIVTWPVKTAISVGYIAMFITYILLTIEKVHQLLNKSKTGKEVT